MANAINRNVLVEGSRNLVVHLHIDADGSGEYTNFPIIDMSAFNQPSKRMKVMSIEGSAGVGTMVTFRFGAESAANHESFYQVGSTGASDEVTFSRSWAKYGGLNNNNVDDPTGDILITTSGFAAAADFIELTLCLKKVNDTSGG